MPRGPRLDYPGTLHHVMARGIKRREIFLDDGACPLSICCAARRLQTGHAATFNRRHRRCGHRFQNRFESVLGEEDPYQLESPHRPLRSADELVGEAARFRESITSSTAGAGAAIPCLTGDLRSG